jgi:hypothetical protein
MGHPERAKLSGGAEHGLSARSGSLDQRLSSEEAMRARRHTKLVREGRYAAEVDVELIEAEDGWGPYLSVDDVLESA